MKKSSNFLAKAKNKFHRLGLKSDPFTESRSITDGSINNVFTGRDAELEQVAQRLLGEERRRILVYGRIGIGKSAFLAKILTDLEEYTSDLLVASLIAAILKTPLNTKQFFRPVVLRRLRNFRPMLVPAIRT
jgi:Cdc6-like AAA superfamily ATPase